MAGRLDAVVAGPRGGLYGHGRRRRCRVWRQRDAAATLHRAQLPHALGVSSDLKVFLGTRGFTVPRTLTGTGRPRSRPLLPPDTRGLEARAWAVTQAARQWRLVSWRARFCAVRVTPAHDWQRPAGSHPKCGFCVNAIWKPRRAPNTTSWVCRPPPRCVGSCASPISALAIEQQ